MTTQQYERALLINASIGFVVGGLQAVIVFAIV